jgi:hypothetical protein
LNKIDYSDFNKFLVSLGLILIVIAIVIPWLFLKEPLDLLIDNESIEKLTPVAKEIISDKQDYVGKLILFIPYVSIGLLLIGVILIVIGLYRWFQKQKLVDKKENLDIKKLELEIDSMTPEQIIEKAKKESDEIQLEALIDTDNELETDASSNQSWIKYINTERRIANQFRKLGLEDFDIQTNLRIGARVEFDIIIESTNNKNIDRIVEIKYFENKIPFSILHKTIEKLSTSLSTYLDLKNRIAAPIIILVYKEGIISPERIIEFKERTESIKNQYNLVNLLEIEFVQHDKVEELDVSKFFKK